VSWAELSLFESHDVVRERFERLHRRELAAAKVAEVTASFAQGHQYFEAAATAGPLVSPLLYYYGVNAISRAVILFLDARSWQATLKPSHGLTLPSWEARLSRGLGHAPELPIAIGTTGTFAELVHVTGGRIRVPVTRDDYTFEQILAAGTPRISEATSVSLEEILGRMPDLNELFEDVLGRAADVYSLGVTTFAQSRRTRIEVFGSVPFGLNEDQLRAQIPELANAKSEPHSGPLDPRPALRFWVQPHDEKLAEFTALRYCHGATWLVLPFRSGLNLSPVAVLYLFAFAAGMFSRYFPQHWLALRSGSRGDRLYPLFREATALLSRVFAGEVASLLTVG